MATKDGNNPLTWVLPDVVDPPDTICVTLRIPNNKFHIMAFKGAMFDLASWWNWERDDAHTATKVARVWRKIFYAMEFKDCDTGQPVIIEDYEDMTKFREDCDGKLFYIDCAGVEHCIAFCDNVPPGAASNSTNNGTPAPGESKQNCFLLNTAKTYLLPLSVNTGDQITLDSCSGFAWDGSEGAPLGIWRYGKQGDISFAGGDVGLPRTYGSDPVNTAPHMSIIAAIGTTPVYLALTAGAPTTVPTVPANSQVVVQVNDSVISDNQGSEDVCITVKNTGTTLWTKTLDFELGTHGDSDYAFTAWSAGVGWQAAFDGTLYKIRVAINIPTATTIDGFEITTSNPDVYAAPPFNIIRTFDGVGTLIHAYQITDAQHAAWTNRTDIFSFQSLAVRSIEIATDSGAASGTISKLVIRGEGTEPIWP